jgi:CheY-like chemotaxis protein
MSTSPSGADAFDSEAPMKVLVYSDDAGTRAQVRMAIGRRPAADLPRVEYVEVATQPAVVARLDQGDIDVAVVDGEAQPAGGLGVCRQAKDEVYDCPPFVAIIARRDDGWLATWSRADAVVSQPLDPMALAQAVADLMRRRRGSRLPVR